MSGLADALRGLEARLTLPDLWQQEAIRALQEGGDVVVDAPTGAGKTFVFEYLVDAGFPPRGQQAIYTVPTRALANDKWREWRSRGWRVGLATGDAAENVEAPVLVATLETQRERLLSGNGPRLLVIDEYQMLGDARRGLNYELALALAPLSTQLLLLSGSAANPGEVAGWLERLGRRVSVVRTARRPVPLDEIPAGALPNRAPHTLRDRWARLAVGALLSDQGPLLIFAPQRRAAESIAKAIASVLPEDDPLPPDAAELRRVCGPALHGVLRKRVAWHHSGLTFAQRAAIVEPLAKAGQLHVIVATMGLAAGINFSVRSVHVSGTTYAEGPWQREVAPDELLQMFGRAGRRGLDESGCVITTDRSPRLADGRPRTLRRAPGLDWPAALRVMARAAEDGRSPFEAILGFGARLFSAEPVAIGFEPRTSETPGSSAREAGPLFGLAPLDREWLNSAGEWELETAEPTGEVALSEALARRGEIWKPAREVPELMRTLLPPHARLCRLPGDATGYGAEYALATLGTESDADHWRLTKPLRALVSRDREALWSRRELEAFAPEWMGVLAPGTRVAGFATRGSVLVALLDFAGQALPAVRDRLGKLLIDPPRRVVKHVQPTHYTEAATGRAIEPRPGTPAHAWRQLGLIGADASPTERGVIFSFFQRGEGLAIAAALEDAHYPLDDLVPHLANLRGGHRFEALPGVADIGSDHLAAVCRLAYGPVDHEGYLSLGLPPGYGEGTAEALASWLERGGAALLASAPAREREFGLGDIERAYIEWLSLLRHIAGAPDHPSPRWRGLKDAVRHQLRRHALTSPARHLPDPPPASLRRDQRLRFSLRQR